MIEFKTNINGKDYEINFSNDHLVIYEVTMIMGFKSERNIYEAFGDYANVKLGDIVKILNNK